MCHVWVQVSTYVNAFILIIILRGRYVYHPSCFIVEATKVQRAQGTQASNSETEFEPRQSGSGKLLLNCYTYCLIYIIIIVILILQMKILKIKGYIILSKIKCLCHLEQDTLPLCASAFLSVK